MRKSILNKIRAPIAKEMDIFEDRFYEAMKSNVPLLNRITYFIVKRKGKQLRPMLIFLIAKILEKKTPFDESAYRGAAVLELIHTATLIHDDVVDESKSRRGFFSVNAIWKNKIAVLVGDFLLAKGLLTCVEHKDFKSLEIISEIIKNMSEGELLQIQKARDMSIDQETYYEIIGKKTSSLIAGCCAMGAQVIDSGDETIKKAKKFGELLGMAFQIRDDLFDYGKHKIGKPIGIDIKERKITLPLIYTLNNVSKIEKRRIIKDLKKNNRNRNTINQIIQKVKDTGGKTYAIDMMKHYQQKAAELLLTFPENKYREALTNMVHYVIERDM